MKRLICVFCLLVACNSHAEEARKITWKDLRPAQQALIMEPIHASLDDESAPAALQLEPNAPVVTEFDGQYVRIPGYIVPLEFDDDDRTREFFLVPYMGACIHVPPPPSNQIIWVTTEAGVALNSLWQPFWLEGRLKVESDSNELASVGYKMEADSVEIYR